MIPKQGRATAANTAGGWVALARTGIGMRRATFGFSSRADALAWLGEGWDIFGENEDPLLWRAVRFMRDYFDREPVVSDFPLDLSAIPPFTARVLLACQAIPYGRTASYGELATSAGNPKAARAAGQAMRRNPMGIIIPCHRTIGANGNLVGFGGGTAGLPTKAKLLAMERQVIEAVSSSGFRVLS